MKHNTGSKILNRSLTLLLTLVVAMVLTVPVFADGEITGKFGTTVAPTISSVTVYDAGGTTPQTSLTPTTSYDIHVTVNDGDGLGELDNLVVKLYADTAGEMSSEYYTEANFDAAVGGAQSGATITWTKSTNTAVLDTGGAASWSLGSSTLPTSADIDGSEDPTSFEFIFPVTIGKAASETDGYFYEWYAAAKITDSGSLSGYAYYATAMTMNWYGEIAVPESHTVDWGSLAPGITYTNGDAKEALGDTINYVANGAYAYTVKSSTVWTATDLSEVALDVDLTGDTDHFALKAYGDDVYESAVQLDAAGSAVNLGTAASGTTEMGTDVASHNLWIALADTMTSSKVYSGTITYGIVNN